MQRKTWIKVLIAVITVGMLIFFFGCGKSGKTDQQALKTQEPAEAGQGEMPADTLAKAGNLDFIFTTDQLFICPTHHFISADPAAVCKICNTKLQPMSADDIKKLRESHPKGCPACGFVVEGASEITKCPSCNQDLVPLEHKEEPKEQPAEEQGAM